MASCGTCRARQAQYACLDCDAQLCESCSTKLANVGIFCGPEVPKELVIEQLMHLDFVRLVTELEASARIRDIVLKSYFDFFFCQYIKRRDDTLSLDILLHDMLRYAASRGYADAFAGIFLHTNFNAAELYHLLEVATVHGRAKIVRMLLKDSRIHIDDNDLFLRALEVGREDVVMEFLADGRIDPSVNNHFALGVAAINGWLNTMRMLLNDVRVRNTITAGVLKLIINDAKMGEDAEVVRELQAFEKSRFRSKKQARLMQNIQ